MRTYIYYLVAIRVIRVPKHCSVLIVATDHCLVVLFKPTVSLLGKQRTPEHLADCSEEAYGELSYLNSSKVESSCTDPMGWTKAWSDLVIWKKFKSVSLWKWIGSWIVYMHLLVY